MFASKKKRSSGSRVFDENRTPRYWAGSKRTECYDWVLDDLLMICVSCFHNLYAVAWPDSLEAVGNIAQRESFSLCRSLLCATQEGVGRDYCLRGDKMWHVVNFITNILVLRT
mmetsp:Transcript_12276/g.17628  ORF Transcript_12276/g.17628 Transcript_12276/m.17628 type:complete len:113 (-) Transcript_12276:1940-2278(-)